MREAEQQSGTVEENPNPKNKANEAPETPKAALAGCHSSTNKAEETKHYQGVTHSRTTWLMPPRGNSVNAILCSRVTLSPIRATSTLHSPYSRVGAFA